MPELHLRERISRLAVRGLSVNSFEIRCMPLDKLHLPVRNVAEFANEIAESLRDRGLDNPVIVVRGPREDLTAEILSGGGNADSMPDIPVVNCVYGGTNRVTAARELGYTAIDCVLVPSFRLALRLQDIQRDHYNASKRREKETTT